jgi:hypothetical protein
MINRYQTLWLGGGPKVRIPVSQYDSMWRFRFSLIENSTPWTIPAGATAGMNGRKPDGNTFSFPADIENNAIVVDSDTQMTAVAGVTVCEVYVISAGKTVATVNFDLVVEEAPKALGDISSDTTLPAYAEILDRIAEMEVEGVPAGGTAGQVLKKASNNDYDVEWDSGGTGATEIEIITIGTATSSDIETAYQAGKAVFGKYTSNNTVTIYPLMKRSDATTHFFGGLYKAAGNNTITVRSFQCINNVWGYAQKIVPDASSATPSALGTAAAGSSDDFSRADHVHAMPSASDVGAIAAPSSPTAGQFLVYNGSAWVAQTVPSANGVRF